jgi:multidrug efflux pump subunit AcrA (membrane-fusion protein)
METKNADLSALRIDRATQPVAAAPGARRWLVIGLPVAGVVVLAAVLVATSGVFGSAVPVRLTPATMVSPIRSGAVLIASGYVVAQRKAAVASKDTGRLVYLGVVEGDRARAGQVIARIEDTPTSRPTWLGHRPTSPSAARSCTTPSGRWRGSAC